MTYKLKLTNLLKEVDEIKQDLEELRLGCKIDYYQSNSEDFVHYNGYIVEDETDDVLFKPISYQNEVWRITFDYEEIKDEEELYKKDIEEIDESDVFIINRGNSLEYHHLMMYCENKDIYFKIDNPYKSVLLNIFDRNFIRLNEVKSLNEQSDEVYKEIYNYLKKS